MEFTAQTALTDDVQPGRALSIKRYFTTPGVHPFDSVEWETRDARIGPAGTVVVIVAAVALALAIPLKKIM